jgi:hypothetical protein
MLGRGTSSLMGPVCPRRRASWVMASLMACRVGACDSAREQDVGVRCMHALGQGA